MGATIILHPATIEHYDYACEWSKTMIAQGYDVIIVYSPNGLETVEARLPARPCATAEVHYLAPTRRGFWANLWPPGAA